jgi:hypothetical protein
MAPGQDQSTPSQPVQNNPYPPGMMGTRPQMTPANSGYNPTAIQPPSQYPRPHGPSIVQQGSDVNKLVHQMENIEINQSLPSQNPNQFDVMSKLLCLPYSDLFNIYI